MKTTLKLVSLVTLAATVAACGSSKSNKNNNANAQSADAVVAGDAKSGSTTAWRSFRVKSSRTANGLATTQVDRLIEIISETSSLKGKLVTTIDPLKVDAPVFFHEAKGICGDLIYANLEGGWRLPTLEELEELNSMEFAHIGFSGQLDKVRGDIWFSEAIKEVRPEAKVEENEFKSWVEFALYSYSMATQWNHLAGPYRIGLYKTIDLGAHAVEDVAKKEAEEKFLTMTAYEIPLSLDEGSKGGYGQSEFLCIRDGL